MNFESTEPTSGQLNIAEQPNLIRQVSETSLNEGVKPIMACFGTDSEYGGQFEGLVDMSANKEILNVKWGEPAEFLDFKGMKHDGEATYVISPADPRDKLSENYGPCIGMVVVGRDRSKKEDISVMTHQELTSILSFSKSNFEKDLAETLGDMKDRCEPGTVDAVVFGGITGGVGKISDVSLEKMHMNAMMFVSKISKDELGFVPLVITAPKNEERAFSIVDNVFFKTGDRQLFVMRATSKKL